MRALSRREVTGAIIIDTQDRFLLQQRDDVEGILHPGKVGLFGGHREGDETFLECVVREVQEELSYFVPAERFEHLGGLEGPDLDVEGGFFRGELFVTRDVPADLLVITEGSLLIIKPDELFSIVSKLTPSANFAINAYLGN